MKNITNIIIIVLALLLLASCSSNEEKAEEFVQYYNEEWVSINDTKEKEMGDLPWEMNELAENNQNEEVAALVENEMIPVIDNSIDRLKAVESENKQVNEMNEMQIEAEEFAKESFKQVTAYYAGDGVSENDVNQYNEELQEKYQDVLDYRDVLMDEYQLEMVENEDRRSEYDKLGYIEE